MSTPSTEQLNTQQNNQQDKAIEVSTPSSLDPHRLSLFDVFPALETKTQPEFIEEFSKASASIYIIDEYKRIKYLSNKFYLTAVQESRQEKAQIIETFGEPSFFFFGERTKIYNFSGTLLETKGKHNILGEHLLWSSSFIDLYDKFMRGTKLAELGHEAVLIFKNTQLFGYIINLTIVHAAQQPNSTSFSFSMIVREAKFLSPDKLNTLYHIAQFSNDPDTQEKIKRLYKKIMELIPGIEAAKIELKKQALIAVKTYQNIPYLETEIQNNFEKHIEWALRNGSFLGIDEKFNSFGKEEIVRVYTEANNTAEYLEKAIQLKNAVIDFNKMIVNLK